MAPVEIDHVPRSIIAPVKNMKVVDKAMSLPLVSSACTQVTRVTSPYMESTYNKISPVVENTLEMVSPVVDSVKTKMEEHIPTKITETVQTYQEAAVDQVIAVVEKVDTIACGGIDQLTEKVPQLKDATPKLIEETKSSVVSFVTRWSEYFASFSVALVALKVVDVSLLKVEEALKKIDSDNAKTMSSLVQMVHSTANTLRHDAAKSAGTPLAQKIDESSLTCALGEVSGLNALMERLGLVSNVSGTEDDCQAESTPEPTPTTEEIQPAVTEETKEVAPSDEISESSATEEIKEVTPEAAVADVKVVTPVEEAASAEVTSEAFITEETKEAVIIEEAIDVATEVAKYDEVAKTEETTTNKKSKKSKKGSKESTPIIDAE